MISHKYPYEVNFSITFKFKDLLFTTISDEIHNS